MNYYIQGNKDRAKEIKAAFERNGIDTSANSNYGISNLFYYSYNGEVAVTQNGSIINIIKAHPDYKELELPVEFKDGDIIGFNDIMHNDGSYTDWIGIYKQESENNHHLFHCVIPSCRSFRVGGVWKVFTAYPATKEQRELLFAKMKDAGYEWDEKKKKLRKIKPHYDIANLKPFDKVLVRQNDSSTWGMSFFGRYSGMFMCCSNVWFEQCIPFNDDTKHLLGTTDMCDEQYINW